MFDEHYLLLRNEASKLGYKTTVIPDRFASYCGHLSKTIKISKGRGDKNAIFEFAHELGHCYQFKKIWKKFNEDKEKVKEVYRNSDKSRIKFMMREIDAWIKGYPILKRNNIDTRGYMKHALFCIKSHIKTKPNSVKG